MSIQKTITPVDGTVYCERELAGDAWLDELLDWRIAVARYRGCRQIIVAGSDHGFGEFGDYVDCVLGFAGL